MTEIPPSPVLLDRRAYLGLVDLAKQAATDPAALPRLLMAIEAIEADRLSREFCPEDEALLELVKPLPGANLLVGDEGGYYRAHPDPSLRKDLPARTLWSGKQTVHELVVIDHPPIPYLVIDRLRKVGALVPSPLTIWPGCPLDAYSLVLSRSHLKRTRWTSAMPSDRKFEGAWLLTGEGEAIGWISDPLDAQYIADCVNMVMRLEPDVSRYGDVNPGFPRTPNGIVGLVQALRRSIQPIERWEKTPPNDLVEAGARLEKDIVDFLSAAAPYRFSHPLTPQD